ncbi:hypothetical protein BJ912DRAFT_936904 [Pholiota molesta]|nr:hypothetical protein BJ912DRAFT_936904 [Pholiota molesta]
MHDLNNWSKWYSSMIFGDKQNRFNVPYSMDHHLESSTQLCSPRHGRTQHSVLLLHGGGMAEPVTVGEEARKSCEAASPRGGPVIRCTRPQELNDANAVRVGERRVARSLSLQRWLVEDEAGGAARMSAGFGDVAAAGPSIAKRTFAQCTTVERAKRSVVKPGAERTVNELNSVCVQDGQPLVTQDGDMYAANIATNDPATQKAFTGSVVTHASGDILRAADDGSDSVT